MTTLRTLACLSAFALVACGGDAKTPFALRIVSTDVALSAVDTVQVVLRSDELNRHFRSVPDDEAFGGSISTRVSNAGEFVIAIERDYLDDHAEGGSSDSALFELDVPLETDGKDSAGVEDPRAAVTFFQVVEPIAEGQSTLSWPLADGEVGTIQVHCSTEGASECSAHP